MFFIVIDIYILCLQSYIHYFYVFYLLYLESNWIAENNLIFSSKFEHEHNITISKTT